MCVLAVSPTSLGCNLLPDFFRSRFIVYCHDVNQSPPTIAYREQGHISARKYIGCELGPEQCGDTQPMWFQWRRCAVDLFFARRNFCSTRWCQQMSDGFEMWFCFWSDAHTGPKCEPEWDVSMDIILTCPSPSCLQCFRTLCCKGPPPPRPEYDVVCIGLTGSGKTSLLSRLCNEATDNIVPTTGQPTIRDVTEKHKHRFVNFLLTKHFIYFLFLLSFKGLTKSFINDFVFYDGAK